MSGDSFPPVEFISPLAPYQGRGYLQGNPHNLPNPNQAPRPRLLPTLLTPAPELETAEGAASISERHRYANIIGLLFAVGTTSALVLASPVGRRNLLQLRNNSVTANLYIDFAQNASLGSVIRLIPNQIAIFDVVVPQDDIYCVSDAVGGSLALGYSTIPI